MKSLPTFALTASALLLSANIAMAKPLSQNQALGQCKTLAETQFDNIKSIKIATMKTTRGTFKVKLRVTAKEEKGMFLCTIERDQDAQIVRLDKDVKAVAAQ
jgi:hypothetical protein